MEEAHWRNFYLKAHTQAPSSFAQYIYTLYLKPGDDLIEFGCGNGRDLYYFDSMNVNVVGVDPNIEDTFIEKTSALNYIKTAKKTGEESPEFVYTRFFWHAIDARTRNAILDWTKHYLFIEARTTEDTPEVHTDHKRNFVSVPQLVADLKKHGFQIIRMEEGRGFSPYKGEDPHLIRVVARKHEQEKEEG